MKLFKIKKKLQDKEPNNPPEMIEKLQEFENSKQVILEAFGLSESDVSFPKFNYNKFDNDSRARYRH